MIEPIPAPVERVLAFRVSGRLRDEDFDALLPLVDAAVGSRGGIRLLFQFEGFRGWGAPALRDDLRFHVTHRRTVDRIAYVGERAWEGWLVRLGALISTTEIRYFDVAEIEAAWLGEP